MLCKTVNGEIIKSLPTAARCTYTGKCLKNMATCPLYKFEHDGKICVPEQCEYYTEYKEVPGMRKKEKCITNKALIDYCNSTPVTHCTSGCPYQGKECGVFIQMYHTTPYAEDKRHPSNYTDEDIIYP